MGITEVDARPGKTAPRLLQDLLDYDPRRVRKLGTNLLIDPPPQYKPPKLAPLRFLPEDCQHRLFRKDDQSRVPSVNEKPSNDSYYIAASYCSKCYHHFDVIVDYRQRPDRQRPCDLNHEYPLHHLQHCQSSRRSENEIRDASDKYDPWIEEHNWLCSAPDCPVVVVVRISSPRIKRRHLKLLTDPELIFRRGTKTIQADPARYEGTGPLTSIDVLSVLRQYLADALKGQAKRVAVRNKKFLLAFSDDCDEIFEFLEFKPMFEDQNDVTDKFWTLPTMEPFTSDIKPKTTRQLVDDVVLELTQRIHDDPLRSKVTYVPLPALKDLEKVLGMTDYPRVSRVINVDESNDESPYFAGLGAVGTFDDQLVAFAYRRQCACDPSNKPYYLECLEDIANGRNSEDLQEELVMAVSLGGQTQKAIDDAYKFFRLDPYEFHDDDHIIGLYRSRVEAAPRQAEEARACLTIIGKARESAKVQEEASNRTMTLEEACQFLNVTPTTESDSIQAAAIAAGCESDAAKVARAVKIIADERKDTALHFYASNLDPANQGRTLDVESAYRRLQIPDPHVPDETVLTYYKSLSQSAPAGSKDSFLEALHVISEVRRSELLKAQVKEPDKEVVTVRAPADQPVGLDNIGNTCYLNSLLQYYYTVKAVREVVMNFDDYRMPLNADTLSAKRVGGRAVAKVEILKAQNFVEELRNLFINLKAASTRSVKPTQDLAELTLFSTATEANFRRASVSSPEAFSVDPAASRPVYGPELPQPPVPTRPAPALTPGDADIEMIDRPSQSLDQHLGNDSTSTLVDLDQLTPNGLDNNQGSDELQGPGSLRPDDNDAKMSLTEISHIENTAEEECKEDDKDGVISAGFNGDESASAEEPPPVPPRNKPAPINTSGESEDTLRAQKLNFGAQQDVTEVIGNVMFRLQCAIKPTSIDPEFGEQIDQIRETFYGANAVSLKKLDNFDVKLEAWANIIVFPSLDGARDIYEALDVVFDEQTVEIDRTLTKQFASISKLPPIVQVQIQRTAYNPVTQQASKNQNRIVFDETIYFDRYMSNEKVLQRRKDAWKWKSRLRQLEARQQSLQDTKAGMAVPDALRATTELLRSLQEEELSDVEIDPTLPEALEDRSLEISQELEDIAEETTVLKKRLQDQFTDMRAHRYRLQAVFMHRGSSSYGHYWIYIYDFERDIWREYNDEYVSVVHDRKQIFEQTTGGATPYYLVYVRDEDKDDLVDAVCREVADSPVGDSANAPGRSELDDEVMDMRPDIPLDINGSDEQTANTRAAGASTSGWDFPNEGRRSPLREW
ncbi:MAG: ubiquitin-specific protease ubp2 [Claussenomyces sp. TS43310]|nr:MAG: ubiquitin-specific protease ubp2 [Claussenomyces sp. TS43310]